MAELRYLDKFVERFQGPNAHQDAEDYVAKRKEKGWTVEDDRPIKLLCNGSLIDTFNSNSDAQKARDILMKSDSIDKNPQLQHISAVKNYVIE